MSGSQGQMGVSYLAVRVVQLALPEFSLLPLGNTQGFCSAYEMPKPLFYAVNIHHFSVRVKRFQTS